MTLEHGVYSLKKSLSSFQIRAIPAWLEYLVLAGLGVLAVVLHQSLRYPMGLSGRHGIEWMALLILGRAFSKRYGAGSVTAFGAAAVSMLPVWGRDDPFIWLVYLIPGPMMDLAFTYLPRWQGSILFFVGMGAAAHATKPLIRWMISLSLGYPYGSLLWGVGYPLMLHILFGAVGGLLAGMLVLGMRKLYNPSKTG